RYCRYHVQYPVEKHSGDSYESIFIMHPDRRYQQCYEQCIKGNSTCHCPCITHPVAGNVTEGGKNHPEHVCSNESDEVLRECPFIFAGIRSHCERFVGDI